MKGASISSRLRCTYPNSFLAETQETALPCPLHFRSESIQLQMARTKATDPMKSLRRVMRPRILKHRTSLVIILLRNCHGYRNLAVPDNEITIRSRLEAGFPGNLDAMSCGGPDGELFHLFSFACQSDGG